MSLFVFNSECVAVSKNKTSKGFFVNENLWKCIMHFTRDINLN